MAEVLKKSVESLKLHHPVEIRIPACLRRTAKCTDPTGARPHVDALHALGQVGPQAHPRSGQVYYSAEV